MSETVLQTGKLVKQNLNGLTKEEYYQKKCEDLKLEKDDGDSWEETYSYEVGEPIKLDGVVYDVVDQEEHDASGHVKLTENPDGTFDFFALYYNGGGCLNEVLESEYNSMKKKSND